MLGQPVQPNVGAELMARPLETPEAEPVEGAKRQDMWWYTRALHADDGRDRVVPCSSRVARVAPVSSRVAPEIKSQPPSPQNAP
jgi:hypothetical protein